MTDIDQMSGAELDALAATSVMGWHENEFGIWMDANERISHLHHFGPCSESTNLGYAANIVLLKALGDGCVVQVSGDRGKYEATVYRGMPVYVSYGNAPTLTLALVRAICKAYEVKHD